MILQAYDFYKLFTEKDCKIQLGGQDQWGNIVCGVELIRKKCEKEVFGLTNPLLTTSDGKKMGKTANGAVWLSKDLLSAYDFWQYWRNVNDADVIKLMYLFTDLPINEIKKMESVKGEEVNALKIILADEITSIVHGRDSLESIHQSAKSIFNQSCEDLAKIDSVKKYRVSQTTSIIDILVETKLCSSRGDAKRIIRGKGVYINNQSIGEDYKFSENLSKGDLLKLSCGKKKTVILEINS